MFVKIEAIQNVTSAPDERGNTQTSPSVVDQADFTAEAVAIMNDKLATLKAKYTMGTTFRLHICANDEQKPCMTEDLA